MKSYTYPEMKWIYFDNAATSYPKPKQVYEAMMDYAQNIGASPGRSAHRLAYKAGEIVYETREKLARLFHIPDSQRLIFTSNATESLNLAILGLLKAGDHVLVSSLEHNSVMRPLTYLQKKIGLNVTVVPTSQEGEFDLDKWKEAVRSDTRLIVVNHGSNVIGSVAPIKELGQIAGGIPFLMDAAQTAGSIEIDVQASNIAMLAFTGHKALFGPQGTGGLYIREDINLVPLKWGGTGSLSGSIEQPDFLPDAFESGTPNTIGIAGLGAGVEFVLSKGVENISVYERELTKQLIEGLENIPGLHVYGSKHPDKLVPVVSFNIEEMEPSEAGYRLDREFGILCRVGLQCAPSAHKTIGTFPTGTVRLSMSYLNTPEQVTEVVQGIRTIAENVRKR